MPRRKRKATGRKRAGGALVAEVGLAPPPRSKPSGPDLTEFLRTLTAPKAESKEDWVVVAGKPILKKVEPLPSDLKLLRSMFKADHPYRSVLSTTASVSTNASGIVNYQFTTAGVSSAAEWTSINALFDEFFVHGFEIIYEPHNKGGLACSAVSSSTPPSTVVGTSAQSTYPLSAGAIIVALQGPPAFYSSSAGMINNPASKIVHTGDSWRFAWRNTVRFDPHGATLSTTTASYGWQGWSYVADAAQYGGAAQVRAVNDTALGNGSFALTTGAIIQRWDVSFRSRA